MVSTHGLTKTRGFNIENVLNARKSRGSQIKIWFLYFPDSTKKILLNCCWLETVVHYSATSQQHSEEQVLVEPAVSGRQLLVA